MVGNKSRDKSFALKIEIQVMNESAWMVWNKDAMNYEFRWTVSKYLWIYLCNIWIVCVSRDRINKMNRTGKSLLSCLLLTWVNNHDIRIRRIKILAEDWKIRRMICLINRQLLLLAPITLANEVFNIDRGNWMSTSLRWIFYHTMAI